MVKKNKIIKKDIVEYLHRKVGFPKKDLGKLLDDVFLLMGYSIIKDKKLLISNFANFEVKNKKERVVLNPLTRQPNKVFARKVVNFQASRKFRSYLVDI